ncbi:MAG: hypothetical protein M1834_004809 [Cirrosporium novae-zelandiae]|nr:MAG: hypothetical protein M1834_004809 [Cirrosporium novae-zelandiae]
MVKRTITRSLMLLLSNVQFILPSFCHQDSQKPLRDPPLLPFVFKPLPLGSIKPQAWLEDEMQLMADGLAGHMYDFYHYVKNNPWLGGNQEYSSLNEAFPYWYNGLVQLAYGLDDQRLKDQVFNSTSYIISHQGSDGWIGPETDPRKKNFWARYPVFLGLTALLEADFPTYNFTLGPMHSFIVLMHEMLANNYTGYVKHDGDDFDDQWGRTRMQDMIISLQWLYEHHPSGNGQLMLDNMKWLNEMSHDWSSWFQQDVFPFADLDTFSADWLDSYFPWLHGVNVGQGLKAPAVVRRFTSDDTLVESARNGVNWTLAYHGNAAGGIIGDERESGLSPRRGTELCTTVETMFSLSYLYHAIGDNDFADKCELNAFNAMPTMVAPDWWTHSYITSPNEPFAHVQPDAGKLFWNVGRWGQTFGLEPNYPCCTVNHPQGFPKYLSASFVAVGDNGIGHALLGPGKVSITLVNGNHISVSCSTQYPFEELLRYVIYADQAFDFYVRVPGWANWNKSWVVIGVGDYQPLSPDETTGMHKISVSAGQNVVVYNLGADIWTEPRVNDAVAIHRGALLYALDMGETFIQQDAVDTAGNAIPSDSIPSQIHTYFINNTLPWNIAIDPSTLEFDASPALNQANVASLASSPFSNGPVGITVTGCKINWSLDSGLPANPPTKDQRTCLGDPFQMRLLPYGSIKVHMAELPTVKVSNTTQRGLWRQGKEEWMGKN